MLAALTVTQVATRASKVMDYRAYQSLVGSFIQSVYTLIEIGLALIRFDQVNGFPIHSHFELKFN